MITHFHWLLMYQKSFFHRVNVKVFLTMEKIEKILSFHLGVYGNRLLQKRQLFEMFEVNENT